MQTLSYGYQMPEDLDRGSVFFDALADNIQQLNDHNHNGVNSALLNFASVAKLTSAVTSGSWNAVVGDTGMFKKSVTFPGAHLWATTIIKVFYNGGTYDKRECFPKLVRTSDTTFDIYVPYDNQAFTLLFM